jgi:transposase
LDDLLHIEEGKLNDSRLYRCLDKAVDHKDRVEQHLKERYGELFGAQFDVLLYDLTSSYVEGAADGNALMRRGYSRDHRPDCKQLVIALVVNVEGFPLSYEVFEGNRADVTTLDEILQSVEHKYGRARRIWVFDRGIVSEENLATLRRRGAQYLVGTPRSKLKNFEQELLSDEWEQVRPEVEVKLVPIRGGGETYVLCRTSARQDKEKAIRSRFSSRIEDVLSRLEKRVREGKLKDRGKIERRIGAILARHPQVADLYKVEVHAAGERWNVQWCMADEHRRWQELREGAYLLRTNIEGENASDLWTKYIQLTEAEAAFRALKSELSIRPIYHQIERRVKAHVMVAFLGYALWVTLKHLLKAKETGLSPLKALALMATIQSADIVLPTTDGREIRLRRVTVPDQRQKELIQRLGWALPERLDMDHECSGNLKRS